MIVKVLVAILFFVLMSGTVSIVTYVLIEDMLRGNDENEKEYNFEKTKGK